LANERECLSFSLKHPAAATIRWGRVPHSDRLLARCCHSPGEPALRQLAYHQCSTLHEGSVAERQTFPHSFLAHDLSLLLASYRWSFVRVAPVPLQSRFGLVRQPVAHECLAMLPHSFLVLRVELRLLFPRDHYHPMGTLIRGTLIRGELIRGALIRPQCRFL